MDFERTKPFEEKKALQWREGDLTVTRSTGWSAPGCHGGCGMLLYTDDEGRLVKVEGDPDDPFNQGRLCVRCLDLPEVVHGGQRQLYPLKRAKEDRGKDKWERITWDEAYDICVTELNRIKEAYGAETVIFNRGTGRDMMPWASRLCFSFGSPNHIDHFFTGIACYMPRVACAGMVCGTFVCADCSQYLPARYDDPSYQVPEVFCVWGNNPVVANADGFYGHWVTDLMKRGSKLMVMDPRLTYLAARAEYWLQLRPGTDAALALGFLNVIINEDLYDHDFVDRWCHGFDQLRERVQEYPVERVAEITWVPEAEIREAARAFANATPATILWGLATDMTKESFPCAHAIISIMAITGNIDRPGGWKLYHEPFHNDQTVGWGRELISDEQFDKRYGAQRYPVVAAGYPMAHPDVAWEAMNTGLPYPHKAMVIQSTNFLSAMASEVDKVHEKMKELEFNIIIDPYMTPTAMAYGDVFLPVCMFPERNGIYLESSYSMDSINKCKEPEGEAKGDPQIVLELGKRLNPEAWPWDTVEEMFTSLIDVSGYTFEELQGVGGKVYDPEMCEYYRYEKGMERADGQPGFNTPTGRIELYSVAFESIGLDPLPYFEEPTESPLSTPELMEEYPLVLTTGRRVHGFFHSEHRQIPRLRAINPVPTVEIHPDTAAKYGIRQGDWVWIENSMGRCRQVADVTPIIDPRVVMASHGWWFPEEDGEEPHLFGTFTANPNVMIKFNPGKSGLGGNYKSLICKIYKVQDGEM